MARTAAAGPRLLRGDTGSEARVVGEAVHWRHEGQVGAWAGGRMSGTGGRAGIGTSGRASGTRGRRASGTKCVGRWLGKDGGRAQE
jgi:hypothetical protein